MASMCCSPTCRGHRRLRPADHPAVAAAWPVSPALYRADLARALGTGAGGEPLFQGTGAWLNRCEGLYSVGVTPIDQPRSDSMSGWYELKKSSNGQFRFVLKAANAEVILTSELYTTARRRKTVSPRSRPTARWTSAMSARAPRTASPISTSRPLTTRSSAIASCIPRRRPGRRVSPASRTMARPTISRT